jgi:hypothetical protein
MGLLMIESRKAPLDRPAFIRQADRFELLRCRCPVCIGLDLAFPREGYQLALFPYRAGRHA